VVVSIRVELSESAYRHAAYIGLQRHLDAVTNNRDAGPTKALAGPRWQNHIEGALGENAVARHFGVYWSARIGKPGPGDIGRTEVKTRPHRGGDLIVQRHNPAEVPYILVWRVSHMVYDLVGWAWGYDIQKVPITDPMQAKSGHSMPAHFFKARDLNPMDDFPREWLL
jgi:hypothetical protein